MSRFISRLNRASAPYWHVVDVAVESAGFDLYNEVLLDAGLQPLYLLLEVPMIAAAVVRRGF